MKTVMLTILCLLGAPSVVFGEASSGGQADSSCQKPKVAVVGAGATGLTAAYLLEQRGYRVTVFEKEPEVGGFARTRFVDGKAFDLATMFVPGSSIAGHGIEPLLHELIGVSGEPLVPAVDFETLVVTPQGNLASDLPLPVFAACSTPDAVPGCVEQLLRGFALHSRYMQCLAQGLDPVACGLVEPEHVDESLIEWGERSGIPLFVQLLLYTADGLGATGDLSSGAPSIGLLHSMSHWMPAEVYRALTLLGVTPAEIPDTLPNLQSIYAQNSQRWYRFEHGYQTFWQSLVKEAGLDVRLAAEVVSVRWAGGRRHRPWTVTFHREGKHKQAFFDLVVVTAPPAAAAALLPDEAPQAAVLQTAVAGGYPLNAYLVPVAGTPQVLGTELVPPFAFWNKDPRIEPSATFVPAVRPFFWQRRYADVDYMLVANYNYSAISTDASFAVLQEYAAATLGIDVGSYTHVQQATFPSVPADFPAWTAAWAELQGQDGLFFSGEAFLGSGVPVITQGLSAFVPRYFPVVGTRMSCNH